MNHSTEHNHKLCAYEHAEPRNNSDRGEEQQAERCVGRRGINATVLDSTKSQRVLIEEEDVEESCNNKKGARAEVIKVMIQTGIQTFFSFCCKLLGRQPYPLIQTQTMTTSG